MQLVIEIVVAVILTGTAITLIGGVMRMVWGEEESDE